MYLSGTNVIGELRKKKLIVLWGCEFFGQVWGYLRVPHYENAIDKQVAATALTHDLIVVTRNESDFIGTGVKLLNPFDE